MILVQIKIFLLNIKKAYFNIKKYIKPKKKQKYINKIKEIRLNKKVLLNNNKIDFFCYNNLEEEYEENIDFSNYKTDIKTICLYLPQFHCIPENDKFWGKGFTEWTNVKKSKSFFYGHYMPREPHEDFGYYNLENIEVMKKQVSLAKEHGIYGFAFYYYWFSGKKLLEKPIDNFLKHKEIDFPFMLVWANENWTRRWDGQNKKILMKQEYKIEDPENFILDLKKYMLDSRYIKIDGKPVIEVYLPVQIPNFKDVVKVWRKKAKMLGIGEIFILAVLLDNDEFKKLNIDEAIDGKYFFPPRVNIETNGVDVNKVHIYFPNYKNLLTYFPNILGDQPKDLLYFPGAMLGFDNSARMKHNAYIFNNFSFYDFYKINKLNIYYDRKHYKPENRFMFVNAWNEWAEGDYLEPDKKFGYHAINTLSRAIFDKPYSEVGKYRENVFYIGDGVLEKDQELLFNELNIGTKIAIQVHIFYEDLVIEIKKFLENIPFCFDLYITTDLDLKKEFINNYFSEQNNLKNLKNIYIDIFENKGRDVYPFIRQFTKIKEKYKYICHIHTKKTSYQKTDLGEKWRQYLYKNLLGSSNVIYEILDFFEKDKNIGMIFPECFGCLKEFMNFGVNFPYCKNFLEKIDKNIELKETDDIIFPAGNMFWARCDSIEKICNIKENDFPSEKGQLDNTILHAIERSWTYLLKNKGYKFLQIRNIYDGFDL